MSLFLKKYQSLQIQNILLSKTTILRSHICHLSEYSAIWQHINKQRDDHSKNKQLLNNTYIRTKSNKKDK